MSIHNRRPGYVQRMAGGLCLLAVATCVSGCGRLFPKGGSSSGITVFLRSKFIALGAGGAGVTLTAQTQGDSTNAGVIWTLTANGAPCSTDCGFLSEVTPFSAAYTPPAVVPASPENAPKITATAVADSTQSDSDSFTVTPSGLTVTITNKVNAVVAGNVAIPIDFRASTQNDTTNSGVSWALSSPGVSCSASTCGTISNSTATIAVYQPPTTASAASVSITATSLHDVSKSDVNTFAILAAGTAVSSCNGAPHGNESLLNGRYAFFAQGTSVIAASFAADGAGHIQDLGGGVGGEIDANAGNGAQHFTVVPTATNASSFYTVGADGTGAGPVGCLSLYTSNGATTIFRFALGKVSSGVATEGRITEFDDQFGATSTEGTRASGPLRLQDTTAFASGDASHLVTNYAFGVGGSENPHAVVVGAFVLDPATGVITNSDFDSDDLNAGVAQSDVQGSTGSIGSVSTKTGRAIFTFTPKSAAWPGNLNRTQATHAAVYVVNASELFLVTVDPTPTGINAGTPLFLYAGRAIASGTGFTSSSLAAGNYILHETGAAALSACSSEPCADVSLGLLSFASGNSSVSATIFEYNAKNGPTTTTFAGSATYAVSATFGRVSLAGTGLTHPPVFYLAQPTSATEPIQAFAGGTDRAAVAASGVLEPGASANVATASLKGNYFFGDEGDPADPTVGNHVGVASISSTGGLGGTQFISALGGLSSPPLNGAVAIDNAKGPGTGNAGANSVAITNGAKLFFVDEASGTPASITVVEPQQ